MLSHGINVVGLFFIVDIIQRRTNTRKIGSLGGIRQQAPFFATAFIILTLGAVALPLTDGFVGEFLLINGIYIYKPAMAAVAGFTIILGAVYMLRTYQRTTLGETSVESEKFFDLTPNEKAVLIPLLILVIVIGIWPNIFLKVSEPAVTKLLSGN
jgi:NADH-quinone oxidoreductase subunit M